MKRSHYPVLLQLVVAIAVGLISACGPKQLVKPDFVRAAAKQSDPRIVIIRTSDNPLYNGPIKWFIDTSAGEVTVFTFKSGSELALARSVRQIEPRLIFTLGAQATAFTRGNLPDVPHVFAMVVNYRRLKMGEDVAGIALEPTPNNEFSQFKMILPAMKRVLAFHTAASKELVAEARAELKKLGIELQTIEVKGPDDVPNAFPKSLVGVDAIWQLNDPKLVTEKVFNFLRERSRQERVPFVTSLSEEFAQAGAMAAVSVDFTSLGAQAATITREILAGKLAKQVGVQPPIGAYLALNLDVAEQINAAVPSESIANVNKVFSTAAKQAAQEQAAVAKQQAVAVIEDQAAKDAEAQRKADEAKKLQEEEEARRKAEEARLAQEDEARRKEEEELKKQEEALKKLQAAKDAKKKAEAAKKKEELAKKREALKKQEEQRKLDEAARKDQEAKAKALAASQKQVPEVAKPSGRFVVFYDPDANHEAILQISSWFTKFLQAIDPELKLQPVRSIGAYEKLQKKGQVSFAILPSSYVRSHAKRGTIMPLLMPSAKGSVTYQKVLFAKTQDVKPKTLAVTAAGASTKELANTLAAAGIPVDGVTIIPVSKDVDALLALVFGQVDAAVVKAESLEVVKTIQPAGAAALKRVKETRPIARTPFVAISGVPPDFQAKVVAALKSMNKNASGARAMRSLGVDAWIDFNASMLP